MDDRELKTEFDGYFKGAELPPGLAADAIASGKGKKGPKFKWVWIPSAAAFAVLAVAGAISLFMRANSPAAPEYGFYTAENLVTKQVNVLTDAPAGLGFAQKSAQNGAALVEVYCCYDGDNLVFSHAEMGFMHNGYRHDAEIYAEYTDRYTVYEEFRDYLEGDAYVYEGQDYIMSISDKDGENVYKIFAYLPQSGIKYYISIMTAEPNGQKVYWDLISGQTR